MPSGNFLWAALALWSGLAAAADDTGREVAQKVCTSCHFVCAGAQIAPIYGSGLPNFAALASRPSITESSLIALLTSPHPRRATGMPNVQIDREQAAAVGKYLLSFRDSRGACPGSER